MPENNLQALWARQAEQAKKIECNQKELVYDLYCKAAYFHNTGDVNQLFLNLDRLLALNPPGCAYNLHAKAFYQLGDLAKVVQLPIFENLDERLDWNTLLLGATCFENLQILDKADQYFTYLKTKYPNNEQVHYFDALRYVKRNQPEKALHLIDQYLAQVNLRAKHQIFVELKLAILLQANEHGAVAEKILPIIEQGLMINPYNPKFLKLQFLFFDKQNKAREATQTLQNLSELLDDPGLKHLLFTRLFREKKYTHLRHQIEQMDNLDASALYYKVILLGLQGQWGQAFDLLNSQAIETPLSQIQKTNLHNFLLCHRGFCSETKQAKHDFKCVEKLGNLGAVASRGLAKTYLSQAKLDKAKKVCEQGLLCNPLSAKLWQLRENIQRQSLWSSYFESPKLQNC